MRWRILGTVTCGLLLLTLAWMSRTGHSAQETSAWEQIAPDVYRSATAPHSYCLVADGQALLIDASEPPARVAPLAKKIAKVLLTHHHRDSCEHMRAYLDTGVPMLAGKESASWLKKAGVEKYWKESLPLRGSRTAYLVVAEGDDRVECTLQDGQEIVFGAWKLRAVATPGHALEHFAFLAQKGDRTIAFVGDALAARGKLWSPYTSDWDHWTDAGLKPTALSLRKLAELRPTQLCPAHGVVIATDAVEALLDTAKAVEEVAFLKSFERFTKERLGNPPQYKFLAKEQATSNGSKPWTQIAEHLFLTGNTYVLSSRERDKACLVVDPWGQLSVKQLAKLRADQQLGPIEVVMFSHAHFDHYDGIYELPDRAKMQVWMLDQAAVPLAEPFKLRAPFLDARPVKFDRLPKEGDTLTWREYRFRFSYLPGQSLFTMGVETTIDGKRCYFTADNFFHQDMFSGSGGWMGLNRSWPGLYAQSARKVLDAAPEWVLAEHGGPYEFSAEDYRRRVQWGEVSARAADAICASGKHRLDWDPHRVRVEPVVLKVKQGAPIRATLHVDNAWGNALAMKVTLTSPRGVALQQWQLSLAAGEQASRPIALPESLRLTPGRHVLPVTARMGSAIDPSDAFLVVDVEE